ncbi:hypothetical protein ACFYYR_03620 [Streptomyces sp. NPDC001922]|uniref:hypothetical protein n=1 Tax=Streptomyces sp. NPDC001922 TaxID=3364624 RepID=UPI0036A51428
MVDQHTGWGSAGVRGKIAGRVPGPAAVRLVRPVPSTAVAQLQAEGHEIREEDITRLSPLEHRNPNLLGNRKRRQADVRLPGISD